MSLSSARVDLLYRALGVLAAALIAFTALGITVDVVIRNLGWGSIGWMQEANEYALFVATFLGAPWVLREGAHVRVDVVVSAASPAWARRMDLLANSIGLLCTCVIVYYAINVASISFREGARLIKAFIIPEWWVFGIIALSGVLLIVEFINRLGRAWRGEQIADGVPGV